MFILENVKIKTTTYPEPDASQSFYSYTLSCTPFYFSLAWLTQDENIKKQFSNKLVVWDFGDGEYYTGENATHYYKFPGNYRVVATVFDIYGNIYQIANDSLLTVYNAIPDIVTVGGLQASDKVAYPLLAGKKSPKLEIYRYSSWQYDSLLSNNGYSVNLYAANSDSTFISVSSYYSSSWSHLKSYFAFIDEFINEKNVLEDRVIDSTKTTSISMYAERINTGFFNNDWGVKLRFYPYPKQGTVFCGTSGVISDDSNIKFVDQKPSLNTRTSYIALYASLDTSSIRDVNYLKYNYKSNEPYGFVNAGWSAIIIKSLFNPARTIKITSNGISPEGPTKTSSLTAQSIYSFDIYPIKYKDTKIPFVLTLKDNQDYTTKCYPKLNLADSIQQEFDVEVSLMEVTLSGYRPVKTAKIVKNNSIPDYKNSGAYLAGLLTCNEEVRVAAISAVALIKDLPVPIPSNTYGFLLQPGNDKLIIFKNNFRYGFFIPENKKFEIGINSVITTINATVSGGTNATYVPGSLKSPLSSDIVWVTNADNDRIYSFSKEGTRDGINIDLRRIRYVYTDSNGRIRSSTVNALGQNRSAAPCSIAADSNGDIWVTLRDCISSFKFEQFSKRAIAVAYPKEANEEWYGSFLYTLSSSTLKGFVGENSILPTSVDVDRQDNVYISYSHPLCSFIMKYDKNGNNPERISTGITYPNTIKQILVDLDDNLWVTTFNNREIDPPEGIGQTQNITDRTDNLYYLNLRRPERSFVKQFSFLGDMTLDSGGNFWVNSRNNQISRIQDTGEVSNFIIGNLESALDYVQDFGGIAGDLDGNLWIINNTESAIYYFRTENPVQTDLKNLNYTVLPDISEPPSKEGGLSYYLTTGDFTGVRWALKNKTDIRTQSRLVSGISTLFTVRDSVPGVVKKNENFNLAETIRSFILQESLDNSNTLLDNFMSPILIGNNKDVNELGKIIYERIANYVDNLTDIDKCNIDSLKSLYEMVGEKFTYLTNNFPPNLRRVINLLSIKKCLLYGYVNKFASTFKNNNVDYDSLNNLGPEIDLEKGFFIPGMPIISYELFSKKYTLIQNTLIPDNRAIPFRPYPLSAINYNWGWGLIIGEKYQNYEDIKNYYKFYYHVDSRDSKLYDGVIDFDDELTTILSSITSYKEWTSFAGEMEYIIGASLYKGLKLADVKNKERAAAEQIDVVTTTTPKPTPTTTTTTTTTTPSPVLEPLFYSYRPIINFIERLNNNILIDYGIEFIFKGVPYDFIDIYISTNNVKFSKLKTLDANQLSPISLPLSSNIFIYLNARSLNSLVGSTSSNVYRYPIN